MGQSDTATVAEKYTAACMAHQHLGRAAHLTALGVRWGDRVAVWVRVPPPSSYELSSPTFQTGRSETSCENSWRGTRSRSCLVRIRSTPYRLRQSKHALRIATMPGTDPRSTGRGNQLT